MVFLLLHILLCALYIQLRKRGDEEKREKKEKFPAVIVFCLPVFGFLMWLADRAFVMAGKLGQKDIDLEKLKVTDEKYRRLVTDESAVTETMVPLEDALIVNDPKLRRSLLLDILHKNPEEYLQTLERAKASDDVEITHYATTTLLEIQGDYEQKLQDYIKELPEHQDDVSFWKEYIHCLSRYVESGLIDGSVLRMQQKNLLHALEKLVGFEEANREDFFLYIESALNLKEYEKAEAILEQIRKEAQDVEKWNRLAVRLYWETGRTDDIHKVLKHIKESNVYLTRSGKEWFQFWSKGNTYEEKKTD